VRRTGLLLGAGLLASACGGRPAADPIVARDSAGITIGPLTLADGRIVAADDGSQEIRVYDAAGAWLETWSRKGGGPGEFEGLGLMFRAPGDTLIVFEYSNAQLSVLDGRGGFVGRTRLRYPLEMRAAAPTGVFSDGTILVIAPGFSMPGMPSGVFRDTTPAYLVGHDGTYGDSIGAFPGPESLVRSTATSVSVTMRPFGKPAFATVGRDRIYVGTANGFEIEVRERDGRLTRIVRRRFAPEPVTRADLDRLVDERFRDVPASRRDFAEQFRQMLYEAPLPDHKPPYVAGLVSETGELWIEEFADPGTPRRVYSVFDSTGRWLAQVAMPPGFAPAEIGGVTALGTWLDDNDVPHIRRYRLHR
jgi:hypothetical protein